jgi:ABC-2 type transport system ATP-binding protein
MKQFAARGGTVLVSSHLMNEMAVTADHLIIIAKGRMVSNCSTQEFINRNTIRSLLVRSHDLSRLTEVLQTAGAAVRHRGDALSVTGLEAEQVAGLASQSQIVIHELSPQTGSLEEAFMSLTGAELEYAGSLPGGDQ